MSLAKCGGTKKQPTWRHRGHRWLLGQRSCRSTREASSGTPSSCRGAGWSCARWAGPWTGGWQAAAPCRARHPAGHTRAPTVHRCDSIFLRPRRAGRARPPSWVVRTENTANRIQILCCPRVQLGLHTMSIQKLKDLLFHRPRSWSASAPRTVLRS